MSWRTFFGLPEKQEDKTKEIIANFLKTINADVEIVEKNLEIYKDTKQVIYIVNSRDKVNSVETQLIAINSLLSDTVTKLKEDEKKYNIKLSLSDITEIRPKIYTMTSLITKIKIYVNSNDFENGIRESLLDIENLKKLINEFSIK